MPSWHLQKIFQSRRIGADVSLFALSIFREEIFPVPGLENAPFDHAHFSDIFICGELCVICVPVCHGFENSNGRHRRDPGIEEEIAFLIALEFAELGKGEPFLPLP